MDAELFKGDGVKPELVTVRSASGVPETIPLYKDGDTVSGFVTVTPGFGKKFPKCLRDTSGGCAGSNTGSKQPRMDDRQSISGQDRQDTVR